MHKKWYDYLWIWSIVYFALGFFNILFAWLGMIDFLVPLPAETRVFAIGTAEGASFSGCWEADAAFPETSPRRNGFRPSGFAAHS